MTYGSQLPRACALTLALLAACGNDAATGNARPATSDAGEEQHAVGAPCLPEAVPEGGFDERESYIETGSLDCETRVCLVSRLRGDPREGCAPSNAEGCDPDTDPECTPPVVCADPSEVAERVYCTCRCDSGDSGFAECECPEGFACTDVLGAGPSSERAGFCARDDSPQ